MNTIRIIYTFKTSFAFYIVCSVEPNQITSQQESIICGTESFKTWEKFWEFLLRILRNMREIFLIRLRRKMICWKRSHSSFLKFSSITIPSRLFGSSSLFNSLQAKSFLTYKRIPQLSMKNGIIVNKSSNLLSVIVKIFFFS